ncbi:hypothetical protein H8699_08915 [Christensenellaceae bacterium NSJ-44]|uniref:Uncharacterized protein n=1 Tax=Luoshenia tenuis TaxID=2763654 RepID=A0A926D238_9FIRM|nr:hypothetical protein [Luoshenia tenuis]MBC8529544.1 hypothetical protein [Luoshenia tenuis]
MAETVKFTLESSSWMTEVGKLTDGLKDITLRSGETKTALEIVAINADKVSSSMKNMGKEAKTAGETAKTEMGKLGTAAVDVAKLFTDTETKYKDAASSVANVGGAITSVAGAINPVAGAVAGLATAFGTMGTWAAEAFGKAHEASVQANLEQQFGKAKWAAEDLEAVAKRLTTTDWTIQISTYMDAKGKMDQTENELNEALAKLNQYDWKVQVGIGLTPEEQEDYKATIDSYIASAQQYAEQQHYTMTLALGVSFGQDSNSSSQLLAFTNAYYGSAENELAALGRDLAAVISKAMEENDFEKYQPDIQKLQGKYNDALKELQSKKFEATIANLDVVLGSDNLKPNKESYDKVMARIKEATDQIEQEASQANAITMQLILDNYDAMIEAGVSEEVAGQIKQQAVDEMTMNLSQNKAEVSLGAFEYTTGILEDSFKDQFTGSMDKIKGITSMGFSDLNTKFGGSLKEMANQVRIDTVNNGMLMDEAALKATQDYVDSMKPEVDKWEALAEEYKEKGMQVPENLSKGITDAKRLQAMTGDTDAAMYLLGQQLANSPELDAMLKQAKENGEKLDESLAAGIASQTNQIYDAESGLFRTMQNTSQDASALVAQEMNRQGMKVGDAAADGLAQSSGVVYDEVNKMWVTAESVAQESARQTGMTNQYEGQLVTHAQAEGIRSGEGEVVGAVQEVNASGAQAAQEDQQLPEALKNKGSEGAQAEAQGLQENQGVLNQTVTDQQTGVAEAVNNDQQVPEAMYGSGANAMMAYLNSLIENGEGPNAQMQAFLMGLGGMLMLSNLPMLAYMLGGNMGTQLGGGLGSQSWFANGQMQAMMDQMNATASSNAYDPRWSGYGANPISMMAGGMYSQMYAINAQADNVNSAMNPLGSFPGYMWGHDFGFGFYSGLHDTRELIIMEANGIASAIRRIMHFSRPDEGPLRDYETWMPHFVEGLAEGMDENRYRVMQAARRLSQSVSDEMGFSSDFDFSDFAAPDWQGSIKVQSDKFFDPEAIMEAVSRAMRENPVVVENRIDNYTTLELDGDVLARKTEPAISRLMQKKSQLAK